MNSSVRRVLVAASLGVALVATALALPAAADRTGDYLRAYDASKAAVLEARPHGDPPGTDPHNHSDPATKNSLSRAGDVSAATQDPTSAADRRAHAAYVARERNTADPTLTTVPVRQPRLDVPQDRYAMANGCYQLVPGGESLFFKPTDLGSYLLYDASRQFVTADGKSAEPSPATVWRATERGKKLRFRNGSALLSAGGKTTFRLHRTTGCARYPESQIDVTGRPTAGITPYQEVRGYVDAHTHGMAFEFLGGEAHCGRPWHEYGAPYALVDCPDHSTTGGYGGVLESVLSGKLSHDPVGWPTFKDWPAPESLTPAGLARVLSVHASAIRQTGVGPTSAALLEAALATGARAEAQFRMPEWVEPEETTFRALFKLAQLASESSDWDTAERACAELLAVSGDAPGERRFLALMANCYLATDRGDPHTAHEFASMAGEMRESAGERDGLRYWWAVEMAELEVELDRRLTGVALVQEAMPVAFARADPYLVYGLAIALGKAIGPEHPADVARLFGAADEFRLTEGLPMANYDQESLERAVAHLRTLLPAEEWQDSLERGRLENLPDLMQRIARLPLAT